MIVIFPCDFFNKKQVDTHYYDEYNVVSSNTYYKAILFDYDDFIISDAIRITLGECFTSTAIYRGWMMKPEQYKEFYYKLKCIGITLVNSPEQYNQCHLFQNSYKVLSQYTPESLYFPDKNIDWSLVNNKFDRFMIKDEVKSVKQTDFPTYFQTPVDIVSMNSYINKFIDLRGNLLTGGLIIKQFVDLKFTNDVTNEYRAFVYKNKLLTLSKNSNQSDNMESVPLKFVEKFLNLGSNFYTIDFAQLKDGSWIVIESGDGQVSGLSPDHHIFKFYDELRYIDERLK